MDKENKWTTLYGIKEQDIEKVRDFVFKKRIEDGIHRVSGKALDLLGLSYDINVTYHINPGTTAIIKVDYSIAGKLKNPGVIALCNPNQRRKNKAKKRLEKFLGFELEESGR